MEYQFQGKQKYNKSLVYSEIVFQCYIIIIIIIIFFFFLCGKANVTLL